MEAAWRIGRGDFGFGTAAPLLAVTRRAITS